jgi:hypothetical protein
VSGPQHGLYQEVRAFPGVAHTDAGVLKRFLLGRIADSMEYTYRLIWSVDLAIFALKGAAAARFQCAKFDCDFNKLKWLCSTENFPRMH